MKLFRSITTMILMSISMVGMLAQEVIVTVAPMQQVLPPQVLLYIADPGKYFTLSLTNTTNEVQQVYLGLQLQQTMPSSGLTISTPANRQPQNPFVIQPNSTYQLNTVEMKKLFDHIPSSEIQCPSSLFSDYSNGSFGLLPEGTYSAKITAYKWKYPQYPTPVVASNPTAGSCTFMVCYRAQAPQFLTPMVTAVGDMDIASVDPLNAQFTWTQPTIACGSTFSNYTYDFRVVELYDGQQPDVAMDRNPVVYQVNELLSNICIIPVNIVTSKFLANKKYLAQVTARQKSAGTMDYVMIENNGKSTYKMFKMKTSGQVEPEPEPEPEPEQQVEPEPVPDPEDEDRDISVLWGSSQFQDSLYNDALYNFRNPTITTPSFGDYGARKRFLRSDMAVSWREVWHLGGEGLQPDTLTFDYEVQLFNGGSVIDKEKALETEPIYNKVIKGTEELTDTIRWDDIAENINEKDYLVLRVKPICTNAVDSTVAFHHDSLNVIDFAIVESLSKQYFQCSNMVDIDNETPTTATAEQLKGQIVKIGEYELTIDEIKAGSKADTWQGKGRVEWNPLGTKVMVCVQFEELKINTDNQVFAGEAKSYSNDKNSNNDIVEKLFSDWGIDNYLTDAGIPFAANISSEAKDKAKGLAEELDLSKYYEYVVAGKYVWKAIGSENIDELYMPIALPSEITNNSPVDIQITTMKFAPTHATMDLIGEFVLPNTDVLQNQILVFGAPRLCISPESVLPESGTIALLADLTLNDPGSDFTFTFNAPKDPLQPVDGCYVSWHANEFELLGIDVAMTIPGLKKDSLGIATDENPELKFQTSIESWDNWMVDEISMDPFQIDGCPGWTFTAEDIIYDHSATRNSPIMGAFPKDYDENQTLKGGDVTSWQGLYIGNISVKMPKALVFGDAADRRCSISAKDMFFDSSGASLTISGDSLFAAKTLKAGGWGFSLDHVSVEFVQTKINGFNGCEFGGTLAVPLINSDIGYNCQILKVNNDKNAKAGNYAYIFRTQQVEDSIDFDFFVAKAAIKKEQTYLLVEATPGEEELETNVELLLGGSLSIGGKEYLQGFVDDLGLEFSIPDVHFAKMRLANCEDWRSEYAAEMQDNARKGISDAILDLYDDKQFQWGDFYFNTGDWSLASKEKFLGPFSFSLSDYDFSYENSELAVYLQGTLKFVESIELSASAGLEIVSTVSGIEEMDFSKLSIDYKEVRFKDASFSASFEAMKLEGSLKVTNDADNGKGFAGTLLLELPGNLFSLDAKGGYFEKPEFTWGYFDLTLSGQGLRFDPIVLSGVHGGFYFNCIKKTSNGGKDGEKKEQEFVVVPQKGMIGVILGITISTSAGEDALKGTFEMTVAYDSENDHLTTFLFTGDLKAVGGLVDAKATILYENNDIDQFFALNITIEAGLSGDKALESIVGEGMSGFADKLSQLNDQYQAPVGGIEAGLSDLGDKSESKADSDITDKAKEVKEKAKSEDVSISVGKTSITIDLRITMKEKGKELEKVKWHLYIGEPSEDKRCEFILIDFKSPIVSVNIGCNAYLCLGNELPNDGELPPIPAKIQEFLDGSTKGSGVKSDDMNKANRSRTRALENFKADVSGGIMLGASAWGFVDVDLGLFYGALEAMAGFDLSLRHLTNMTCMNMGKDPGYHGWYGEGQIYAYLAAVLGLKLDLGFWTGKLPILDAGIGGVLRMGGINPNYFTGAARVKLNAFGGLVDINRKFEFECGDVCDLFYGNALDNFELFGECSIGDSIKDNGWGKGYIVDPYMAEKPSIETTAPLNEHFRVLDETEYHMMLRDWEGDEEALKMQANRTFVFRMHPTATLYEFNSDNESNPARKVTVTYDLHQSFRTRHIMDIFELNPNKYYRLDVTGSAKELYEGVEDHPQTYDTIERRYYPVPWVQTRSFYFRTGNANMGIKDRTALQDYVAFAYPSDYGQLKGLENVIDTAYVTDIANPVIALKRNIYGQAFMKGNLLWTLYDSKGNQVDNSKVNVWDITSTSVKMRPSSPFNGVVPGERYRLKLVYTEIDTTTTNQVTPTESRPHNISSSGTKTISAGSGSKTLVTGTSAKRVASASSASSGSSSTLSRARSLAYPSPISEEDGVLAPDPYLFAEFETEAPAEEASASPQVRQIRKKAVQPDSVTVVLNNQEVRISQTTYNELRTAKMISVNSAGKYVVSLTSDKSASLSTNALAELKKVAEAMKATQLQGRRGLVASGKDASGTGISRVSRVDATDDDDEKIKLPVITGVTKTKDEDGEESSAPKISLGASKADDEDDEKIKLPVGTGNGLSLSANVENEADESREDWTEEDWQDYIQSQLQAGIDKLQQDRATEEVEQRIGEHQHSGGSSQGIVVSDSPYGEKPHPYLMGRTVGDTTLVDLDLYAVEGNWKTGYVGKDKKRVNTNYEIPFLGMHYWSRSFKTNPPSQYQNLPAFSDENLSHYHVMLDNPIRLSDPYWYISYLSNYAFIGGWRIAKDKGNRIGIQATTSQSLIYTDLGGSYEGYCSKEAVSYRIKNELDSIRRKSIYIPHNPYEYYPLPIMEYDLHAYRTGGDARVFSFTPATTNIGRAKNALDHLNAVYNVTTRMNNQIYQMSANLDNYFQTTNEANWIKAWVEARAGQFITVSEGPVKLEVPTYQIAIVWSGGLHKLYEMMSDLFDQSSRVAPLISSEIWLNIYGRGSSSDLQNAYKNEFDGKYIKGQPEKYTNKDYLNAIDLRIYRIDEYDFVNRQYKSRNNTEIFTVNNPLTNPK